MDDMTASNYLKDLGQLIKEKAVEAKKNSQASRDPYNIGFLMAFHEVISLMQSQAVAFGLPLDKIGLSDINSEMDLL